MPRSIFGRRNPRTGNGSPDWQWVPGMVLQFPEPFAIEKLVPAGERGGRRSRPHPGRAIGMTMAERVAQAHQRSESATNLLINNGLNFRFFQNVR
jgi:hypothetical protein